MAAGLLSAMPALPNFCSRQRSSPIRAVSRSSVTIPRPQLLSAAVASATLLWHLDMAARASTAPDVVDPAVARLALNALGPALASFNLLFVARIVMSWYPKIPVEKLPFVIAYAPTEPVLAPTRRIIRPIGGVDMAPVAWFALLSLINELLLGQQGLLAVLAEQR